MNAWVTQLGKLSCHVHCLLERTRIDGTAAVAAAEANTDVIVS